MAWSLVSMGIWRSCDHFEVLVRGHAGDLQTENRGVLVFPLVVPVPYASKVLNFGRRLAG